MAVTLLKPSNRTLFDGPTISTCQMQRLRQPCCLMQLRLTAQLQQTCGSADGDQSTPHLKFASSSKKCLSRSIDMVLLFVLPLLQIRPACLRPNMAKCGLAIHGKDSLEDAKSTGSVSALTHGVGLWGAFAQATPRRRRQNASYLPIRIPTRSIRSQRWIVLIYGAR